MSVIVFLVCNCTNYSPELTEALILSGENRKELLCVLDHYEHDKDSLKYKAACFLIENMRWHKTYQKVQYVDPKIPKLYEKLDYLYTKALNGFDKVSALDSNRFLEERLGNYSYVVGSLMEITSLDTNVITRHGVFEDCCEVDADFLIFHIDNAFKVWRESKYAKNLDFDDFCEYILPYRSFWGTTFLYSGAWLNERFAKHLWRGTTSDFRGYLKRYNHYVNKMYMFAYPFRLNERIGICDLFLNANKDCALLADNACNVFRACGFPVTVDYTIAFKAYTNRHFYCSYWDSAGTWRRFNPGFNWIVETCPTGHVPLNLFRNTFAAQKDTPYFLRAKAEKIPGELASPCIKDVTGEVSEQVELALPFTKETDNHLAYLCTCSGDFTSGLVAVTWGSIDNASKQVVFKHALYNTLYFPMYMKDEVLCSFGEPFYVIKDSLARSGFRLCHLYENPDIREKGNLLLTRKYPLKSALVEAMERMVGGRFEGANREDFSDAETLFTISEPPRPYWQEYVLNNNRAYRYYRYVAPFGWSWVNVAELEFLVRGDVVRSYTSSVTPLPIFKEEDISLSQDDHWVQVLEKDTVEMRKKPYFDKNILTSSWGSSCVVKMPEQLVIERVRMIPRNAGNDVQPGDRYLLLYWDNEWKKFGVQRAKYNFLKFENVPLNKIYWLRNLDRGIEDLPFVYEDGRQKFIYDSVIVDKNVQIR